MNHRKTPRSVIYLVRLGAVAIVLNAVPVEAQDDFTVFDFPGATETLAYGINNAGQIVGAYKDGGDHGFQLDPAMTPGTFTAIDYPDATNTYAIGINNLGQVVGYYKTGTTPHGFLLDGSAYTTIDFGIATAVAGINDGGQMVGQYQDRPTALHGFRLDPDISFTRIDYPGAFFTVTSGINNDGQIVGSYIDRSFRSHGFLLNDRTFSTIDVPGAMDTSANGINNTGAIVGDYTDPTYVRHGFMLAGGTFTRIDLPNSVDTSCWGVSDAVPASGIALALEVIAGSSRQTPSDPQRGFFGRWP